MVGECFRRRARVNAADSRRLLEIGEIGPIARLRPGFHSALVQRLALIWNDKVEIEIDGVAESLAPRTCAERIVEREQLRLGIFVSDSALLAFE